jgi:methylenetetrahydrofolate reductase (NADPH)
MSLNLSFEFFPPKSPTGEAALYDAALRLAALSPDFLTVTYGAGGSTRDATGRIVRHVQNSTRIPTASHLTCVGHSREDVDTLARDLWQDGIRHIVALRGDAHDGTAYTPHPGGYAFAVDLIAGLKQVADFEISVAAYPETHPQAVSATADLDNLKRKLEAGGTRAITQFFFDNSVFYRFLDRAARAGITAPIIPGMLPVYHYEQACRFAKLGGASIPKRLHQLFDGLENKDVQAHLATHILAEQCLDLQNHGIDHLHFYTLNRAEAALAVGRLLNIPTPQTEDALS